MKKSSYLPGVLLVGIPFVDQILKLLALRYLSLGPVEVVADAVELRLVKNAGAAFGIGCDHRVVLLVVSFFALIWGLLFMFFDEKVSQRGRLALSMVMGGGIANLIDRIFRGFVVDFIDLKFLNFAVFNFADIFITLGTAAIIFLILKSPRHNE